MTLRAILRNNAKGGMMLMEVLLAIAIISIVIPAAVSVILSSNMVELTARRELATLGDIRALLSDGIESHMALLNNDYPHQLGKNNCRIGIVSGSLNSPLLRPIVTTDAHEYIVPNTSSSAQVTDVVGRNGFVYETLDSPIQSDPDFNIVNVKNPQASFIVSSINTGPGLSSVVVAGHYAYVANESSASQLQVIDIANRISPVVVAKLKLPYVISTTTRPHAVSIYYDNGLIYLGTEKWAGNELNIIDVSNPLLPKYIGGLDTDTVVNATTVHGYAYIAGADVYQLRIVDVSNPNSPQLLSGISPAGFGVLEGKSVAVSSSSKLYFARAGGGFDNSSQYELFSFDIHNDPLAAHALHSENIVGGVYGLVSIPKYVFVAVGNGIVEANGARTAGGSIGMLDADSLSIYRSITLPTGPTSLMCDQYRLYVPLSGSKVFAIIDFSNDSH